MGLRDLRGEAEGGGWGGSGGAEAQGEEKEERQKHRSSRLPNDHNPRHCAAPCVLPVTSPRLCPLTGLGGDG